MTATSAQRVAALSWAKGRELPPQRLWTALREAGSLEALLAMPREELAHKLGSAERVLALLRSPEDREAERWASGIERTGMRLVTAFDGEYPKALSEIPDPPFVLFALGLPSRLQLPAVAIVGSRAASRYGREVAARLARDLSLAGVVVVSGFARGVDGAAHQAAREGPGGTIAVLGCGLDIDYPHEHARLKEAMAKTDLLLSEYPPGTHPQAAYFPVRNRIIAGIASGVVVVEASRRSGSLITARLANDCGRDVFAVPGSVFSETSAGANELLKDGAILCRSAEDVLAELFPSVGRPRAAPAAPEAAAALSAEARTVLNALTSTMGSAATAEDLVAATDLPAATVLAALFELESAGLAVEDSGRYGAAPPPAGNSRLL
jgi:DNA processing protein